MRLLDDGRRGIMGRRAASVRTSRSCSRLRREGAHRRPESGAKAGAGGEASARSRVRASPATGASTNAGPSSPARATSRDFRNRLQNRAAVPVTRRQPAGLPGERRCSGGDHDARGPSWTQGPGAARDQGTAPPLQMPGYAMPRWRAPRCSRQSRQPQQRPRQQADRPRLPNVWPGAARDPVRLATA